ncbi:MAG: hypothetical protein ACFFCT_02220, partial [Candidatus Odinarchaeota archaeon]
LSWNALVIVGFLVGLVFYAMTDFSSINKRRQTIFMGWLLLLNIIDLGIILNSLITDVDSILTIGFTGAMFDFLFSTPILLSNFIEERKSREES